MRLSSGDEKNGLWMRLWLVESMLHEILMEQTNASAIHSAHGMTWKPKNNNAAKARWPDPGSVGIASRGVYVKNEGTRT